MPSERRVYDVASAVFFAVAALVALATFRDYGITLDEESHLRLGNAVVRFYAGGFELPDKAVSLYGAGFDVIGAGFRHVAPLGQYDALHLLGVIVGFAGLAGAWRLGRLFFGPAGAFWALVFLTLTPAYYGHMFNNPKDVPFAAAYVWAVYAIARWATRLPRARARDWVAVGCAIGAAASVRVAGLALVPVVFVAVLVFAARQGRLARSYEVALAYAWKLGGRAVAAAGVAWGVMLLFWPWAWSQPIRRPIAAGAQFSDFSAHVRQMPYGGVTLDTSEPAPWDYLLRYFGIKLPELLLVLALIGTALGACVLVSRTRARRLGSRELGGVVVLLAGALLPVVALVRGSPLYDGLRQFLFLVPLICVVAAGAFVYLNKRLVAVRRPLAWALTAVTVLLCGRQVHVMRQLHPHEYVYFNELVGGLDGAYGRYSTDYYGTSYRDAFLGLRDHLWATEPDEYLHTDYTVRGCFRRVMADEVLPANFTMSYAGADFLVGFTRADCHEPDNEAPIIVEVKRQNTPLAIVRDERRAK